MCGIQSDPSRLRINLDWFETSDEQNLKYIVWHEVRHLYQLAQIEKSESDSSNYEDLQTVNQWKNNFDHYIYNTKGTIIAHMNQEIEIDAYSFAVYMLFKYCANPDGSIDIGLPPYIETEIIKRVEGAFARNINTFTVR